MTLAMPLVDSIGDGRARRDGVEWTNVRMDRFNEALNRFLELLDERATIANFQTALPHLEEKLLDSARKQFVFHLKDAIKMEKDRLVESYALRQRLFELEELTQEAEARNEDAKRKKTTSAALHRDAWRPNVDIDTAIHAPLVPQARDRVAALEAELAELERENDVERAKLEESIQEEETRRGRARKALDLLSETLEGLESSADEETRLTNIIDLLLAELGPRGIV